MLSSDDLDVMQTFLTLVTCDNFMMTMITRAGDDEGGDLGNNSIGHLINDDLQLLLDGRLVRRKGVHPRTQTPNAPSPGEACHLSN